MSLRKVNIDEPMAKLFQLSKYLSIPLNQRSYEWGDKEISEYLNDILQSWKDSSDYCTGMFIVLSESETTYSLWDGQQRTITYMLILIKLLNSLKQNNDNGFYNDHIKRWTVPPYEMTQKEQDICKKHDWNFISKVQYCTESDEDTIMLTELLHNRIRVVEDMIAEPSIHNDNKYVCKLCNLKCSRLNDAKRHILNRCKEVKDTDKQYLKQYNYENNNIMNALRCISHIISSLELTHDKTTNLIKYMLGRVKCDIEICADVKSAAKRFEYLNNRGKPVSLLTIAKSRYLAKSSTEDQKMQIAKYFQSLENLERKFECLGIDAKNFFEVQLRIYLKAFSLKKLTLIDLMQDCDCLNNDHLFDDLDSIHRKVSDICDVLASREYKFTRRVLKHDTMTTLVIPMSYKYGLKSVKDVMNIVLSHLVRVKLLVKRHPQYTWFEYLNAFNGILAKAYSGDEMDFIQSCNEIRTVLWTKSVKIYESETIEQFAQHIKDMPTKKKNNTDIVKFILAFYIENTKTDVIIFDVSEADLEHIWSKDGFDKGDTEQNRIGNCTLLEAKNSERHKGNRSIKNAEFETKLTSYKGSNLKINTDIYDMFSHCNKFDYECINRREEVLCKELFAITDKYLNPPQASSLHTQ